MSSTPQPEPGAPATSSTAAKRSRAGRVSDLKKFPELASKISGFIASGQFASDACLQVGISEGTFHRWMEMGRAPNAQKHYREFHELIREAEAKRRVLLMGHIAKAAKDPKHHTAAQWILTHTDPEKFTPNIRVHVTQELEGALHRLKAEFANEPEIFERILATLALGAGLPMAQRPEEGGSEGAGEEPPRARARAARGVEAPTGVPGPRR